LPASRWGLELKQSMPDSFITGTRAHDANDQRPIVRTLFVLTVVYAGAMFWLSPHLPMSDLPQHAGQVALLRDMLFDRSPWQSLFRINYFTPYQIGYAIALPLSLVIPISAALKLMLMLAFYAFIAGGVMLRRRFDADERLDWLFIPGFFGLAYLWGLFTFLVAAPLGLFFVLLADIHAEQPTPAHSALLSLAGLVLFFSHGLVFLLGCSIGVGLILVRRRNWVATVRSLLPYAVLAALSVLYAAASTTAEGAVGPYFPSGAAWNWDIRRLMLINHIFGVYDIQHAIFAGVGAFMLFVPRLLRSRLIEVKRGAFVPMAVMMLVWLAAPHYAMKTSFIYERFALFFLPFYALMFHAPSSAEFQGSANRAPVRICEWLLCLFCWAFLLIQTVQLLRFARESKDFETVQAAAEPGQRALALVLDAKSQAAANPWAYLSYPLWYQAEYGGLVDFNFAWYPPQIVRYRQDALPAVRPGWEFQTFNWTIHQGWRYRYFFVRHTMPLSAELLGNDSCQIALLRSAGSWSLYEARYCQ
jgi:hypothetical protein